MAKKPTATPVVSKYPEVGFFADKKSLQKHYKPLTDAELAEWMALYSLTHKPCDHAAINRMRMAEKILYLHFPALAPKPKAESPYKQYTTEALIEMAATNSVPVEATDNMKILRMRTIQALRAHKLIG
jgi:hypothetical protein